MENEEIKFLIKDGEEWFELAPPNGYLVPLPMNAVPPKDREPTHFHNAWEMAIGKMIEAMPDHFKNEKQRIGFIGPPRFIAPWMHMGGLEIEAPIRPPIHLSFDCTDLQKSIDNLAVAARVASLKLGGVSRIMMTPLNSFHTWRESTSLVLKRSQRRQKRKAKQPAIRKLLQKR